MNHNECLRQGYFPTEYNIDCFKAYRKLLDSCLGELQIELDKLNELDLLNCDKVLKDKRRHLVRRIQVHRIAACCYHTISINQSIIQLVSGDSHVSLKKHIFDKFSPSTRIMAARSRYIRN